MCGVRSASLVVSVAVGVGLVTIAPSEGSGDDVQRCRRHVVERRRSTPCRPNHRSRTSRRRGRQAPAHVASPRPRAHLRQRRRQPKLSGVASSTLTSLPGSTGQQWLSAQGRTDHTNSERYHSCLNHLFSQGRHASSAQLRTLSPIVLPPTTSFAGQKSTRRGHLRARDT